MNVTTRFAPAEQQMSCHLDDESVLLALRSGTYYGLNPIASRVWRLLQEAPRTLDEILDVLVAEFDVERAQCAADVRALLNEMIAAGLVAADEPA